MSEWTNIAPFTRGSFNGTKPAPNTDVTGSSSGGSLPPTTSPWSGLGTSDVNDGTRPYDPIGGTKPPIIIATDYWLRDDGNEAITDQLNDPISLEGLRFTNA